MGTRWNSLTEAVLTSTHNLHVCSKQKYEKYQDFYFFLFFCFLEVKFSIYLNRHAFVVIVSCTYSVDAMDLWHSSH